MSATKRTNVSVAGDLLDEARVLGLNVSGIAEAALDAAVREKRMRRWKEENAAAIARRRDWIERNGLPLADIQLMHTMIDHGLPSRTIPEIQSGDGTGDFPCRDSGGGASPPLHPSRTTPVTRARRRPVCRPRR